MRFKLMASLPLLLLVGCPSNQPQPQYGGTTEEVAPAQRGMSPEQYEEIKRAERAGQTALTACYTDELERRGDKQLQGKVTVQIDIGTNSAATQVHIIESTLKAPRVEQCIQQQIMKWEFPKLTSPEQYGTTFAFSPAY